MLGGVPVLGEDDVVEFFGEGVDEGDDGVAVGDGQGSAGHEVVLDVDDEEGVGGLELHGDLMVVQGRGVRSCFARCPTQSFDDEDVEMRWGHPSLALGCARA